MKILEPGHEYEFEDILPEGGRWTQGTPQKVRFVKRFRGDKNHPGTLNQELLRVLINRVEFLDNEVPWEGNQEILKHLRMALVLHESRALFRKVDKGTLKPEEVETDEDGHFKLKK